jgi:signal transduction histidine kinase
MQSIKPSWIEPLWVRLLLINLAAILIACASLTVFILFRTRFALANLAPSEFEQLQVILRNNEPLGSRILLQTVRFELFLAGVVSLLLALGFALLVSRYLARSFERFAGSIHRLAKADWSARTDVADGPRELAALGRDINRMAERLEHLESERRFESAAIAHELRTPITAMRLRVLGMIDGVYPLESRELEPLNAQLNTMQRLAEDLQTLTLANAGHFTLQLEPIWPRDLFKDLRGAFQPLTEARDQILTLDTYPHLELNADPHRLRQALSNLIENALKHTPNGGRIEMTAIVEDLSVNFKISDDGPGVPEAELERLFIPFYRLESSRSRDNGGSGLGLAIVRAIAEAHGGRVWAKRSSRGGLEVCLTIPH